MAGTSLGRLTSLISWGNVSSILTPATLQRFHPDDKSPRAFLVVGVVKDLRVPCECRVRMTPDFYSDKLKSGSAAGRAFFF